ncbi:M48 family metallopeptidase [Psychrobacter sp. 72-O-c]|uniref:M48 family metallopeptidase n=1 Tax=Psychrobacter sp. 72-O-c TaxID=2774125 RepID=UPI001D11F0B8|nr:SprT family zinc-dependent metalloprotease [Psychrobacter sp. 72-O-c]
MEPLSLPQKYVHPLLESAVQCLAQAGITLQITPKHVKNINFRLKPYQLRVSVPLRITAAQVAQAVTTRVPRVLANHPQILAQYERKQNPSPKSPDTDSSVLLWGVPQTFTLSQADKVAYYRQQLSIVMPELFDKWQPIVGAEAREIRIKKMHTRWGSCNTRARRIWLSVHLPAYPIECTEYVIVHELCHLHHANHSRAFWQTVATAMPEYKQWHDMLAGKSGVIDNTA